MVQLLEEDLLFLDYKFQYYNVYRFVVLHKYGLVGSLKKLNVHKYPIIKKGLCVLIKEEILNIDSAITYNFAYFGKFFFGRNAYVSSYKTHFSYAKTYYSYEIQVMFNMSSVFELINFLVNYVKTSLNKNFYKYYRYNVYHNVHEISVSDMNFFVDLKTNLGLYSLVGPLSFRFYMMNCDFNVGKMLINMFHLV